MTLLSSTLPASADASSDAISIRPTGSIHIYGHERAGVPPIILFEDGETVQSPGGDFLRAMLARDRPVISVDILPGRSSFAAVNSLVEELLTLPTVGAYRDSGLNIVGRSRGLSAASACADAIAGSALVLIAGTEPSALLIAPDVPVLAVLRAGDVASRALFRALPNVRYAEVASAGDAVAGRPAEVLSLIEAFFNEPARYAPGTTVPQSHP